jgi:hypothetical protein
MSVTWWVRDGLAGKLEERRLRLGGLLGSALDVNEQAHQPLILSLRSAQRLFTRAWSPVHGPLVAKRGLVRRGSVVMMKEIVRAIGAGRCNSHALI